MVADRGRAFHEAEAKKRQQVHGGTAPGKSKSLVEPGSISVSRGNARDAAGKAVGVDGRTVDMARQVRRDGIPELAEAAKSGKEPGALPDPAQGQHPGAAAARLRGDYPLTIDCHLTHNGEHEQETTGVGRSIAGGNL